MDPMNKGSGEAATEHDAAGHGKVQGAGDEGSSAAAAAAESTGQDSAAPEAVAATKAEHPRVTVIEGRRFEEHYERIRELGKGKNSYSFECRDRLTGEIWAAKVQKTLTQVMRRDALRELEVMNVLRHPTILLMHDAFDTGRTVVQVTELLQGGELLERLCEEQYVLREQKCALYMRQVCEGLAYMHHQGVLHLDLKPSNILFVDKTSDKIKIIDFTLARFYKPGEPMSLMQGTPQFMAPELAAYDEVDITTDMWSVGILTYVMLSGISPFLGATDTETLTNLTTCEWEFDETAFEPITEDAKDFICSLLIKRKEKRLNAEQGRQHPWLARDHDDELGTQPLDNEKLRAFTAAHRKRWHITSRIISAMQKICSMSAPVTSIYTPGSSIFDSTMPGKGKQR